MSGKIYNPSVAEESSNKSINSDDVLQIAGLISSQQLENLELYLALVKPDLNEFDALLSRMTFPNNIPTISSNFIDFVLCSNQDASIINMLIKFGANATIGNLQKVLKKGQNKESITAILQSLDMQGIVIDDAMRSSVNKVLSRGKNKYSADPSEALINISKELDLETNPAATVFTNTSDQTLAVGEKEEKKDSQLVDAKNFNPGDKISVYWSNLKEAFEGIILSKSMEREKPRMLVYYPCDDTCSHHYINHKKYKFIGHYNGDINITVETAKKIYLIEAKTGNVSHQDIVFSKNKLAIQHTLTSDTEAAAAAPETSLEEYQLGIYDMAAAPLETASVAAAPLSLIFTQQPSFLPLLSRNHEISSYDAKHEEELEKQLLALEVQQNAIKLKLEESKKRKEVIKNASNSYNDAVINEIEALEKYLLTYNQLSVAAKETDNATKHLLSSLDIQQGDDSLGKFMLYNQHLMTATLSQNIKKLNENRSLYDQQRNKPIIFSSLAVEDDYTPINSSSSKRPKLQVPNMPFYE